MSTAPVASVSPSDFAAGEVRAELARRGLSLTRFAEDLGVPSMWTIRRLGPSRSVDLTLEDASRVAAALGWELVDLIDSARVLTGH